VSGVCLLTNWNTLTDVNRTDKCRCGHTWAEHYQTGGTDLIGCDVCPGWPGAWCEDYQEGQQTMDYSDPCPCSAEILETCILNHCPLGPGADSGEPSAYTLDSLRFFTDHRGKRHVY
jgi:hypothetical protein